MNTDISYEYYSTFAPVACAFLSEDPQPCKTEQSYELFSPEFIDNGYCMYVPDFVVAYKIIK